MCEMNVKGALSETVAGTKWLQDTQRAVIVAVILQSYSIVPPQGEKKMGSVTCLRNRVIASRGFLSTFVADNTDRLRSKFRRCHLTPDVRGDGLCWCVTLSVHCSVHVIPYLQTSAAVSHGRLASLCMSLIPSACEVKC